MPASRHYRIAYSGGMDSHVLLAAMASLREEREDAPRGARISAIHINHNLQPDANRWARHARAVCEGLAIPCEIISVDARPAPGESPEAIARRARYRALKAFVGPDEILLAAHHRDDQAETVLLQLFRGAGPRGLAAMPLITRFGSGFLARPLLDIPRDRLREYAKERGLAWIEDASNRDQRFDRNYLRHRIIPALQARWPAIAHTLGRAAAHQADAARQLEEQAGQDLEELQTHAPSGREESLEAPIPAPLSCRGLQRLPEYRRRNALTGWFRRLGLPAPNAVHMERVLHDVIQAKPDAEPRVSWNGAEVRRYRDGLHAGRPLPPHDPARVIPWTLTEPLSLPHLRLEARRVVGKGIRAAACPGDRVEVRFRQGGERYRTAGGHTHSLKKLLQERGIPPWERARIPLIFVAGELAAVGTLWVCYPFRAGEGEEGWILRAGSSFP
uniref:tRNA(Ile)-lysidine synthase n=1 Tax=Candidatus Kentrum sp. DK TaxID=2126562 RepID=A0A450T584_9GAMM|nr:MAG: tRNA(Ile)-lysidine synthase [Candidatus Kentron sp. DK]